MECGVCRPALPGLWGSRTRTHGARPGSPARSLPAASLEKMLWGRNLNGGPRHATASSCPSAVSTRVPPPLWGKTGTCGMWTGTEVMDFPFRVGSASMGLHSLIARPSQGSSRTLYGPQPAPTPAAALTLTAPTPPPIDARISNANLRGAAPTALNSEPQHWPAPTANVMQDPQRPDPNPILEQPWTHPTCLTSPGGKGTREAVGVPNPGGLPGRGVSKAGFPFSDCDVVAGGFLAVGCPVHWKLLSSSRAPLTRSQWHLFPPSHPTAKTTHVSRCCQLPPGGRITPWRTTAWKHDLRRKGRCWL